MSHAKANAVLVTTTMAAIRFASVWKVEKTVKIRSLKARLILNSEADDNLSDEDE